MRKWEKKEIEGIEEQDRRGKERWHKIKKDRIGEKRKKIQSLMKNQCGWDKDCKMYKKQKKKNE